MERVLGTHKTPKFASQEDEDVISRLPDNVIAHILDRLPLHDAVRTSILSRDWRFKWNMLTQLVFDIDFFKISNQNEKNIRRILFQHKGSITKFVLSTPYFETLDVEELSLWVMFLSTKGINDLTLLLINHQTPLKLPSHLFSSLEMKHLNLQNCSFHTPPTFCGFPNLLSLDLCRVTDIGNSVEFFTKCPLLEILRIICYQSKGKVKLVDIAKLKNLKVLWLQMHILDCVTLTSSTIFQLRDYLPKLQDLFLDFDECKFVGETGARKSVHTFFPCLKTLELLDIDLNNSNMLACTIEMIWGSPNLQSLKIIPLRKIKDDDPPPAFISSEVDVNTLGQLQLQDAYIATPFGSVNEVCLIKYLFGCSPLLKKIIIESSWMSDGKLELAKKLLMFPRASTIAEVELCT